MANTSRSQVTITLGRSGQVVKRAGAVLDTDFHDLDPAVGSKRSVKDRLGSSVDAIHSDNKRQCGVNGGLHFKASNNMNDTPLSKHDLRFKIKKRTQSNVPKKNVDLRDMLSRKTRPVSTNRGLNQGLREPSNSGQRAPQLTPEPTNDRRRMPEPKPKDDQWRIHDERRPVPVQRDGKGLMGDPIEVGPCIPSMDLSRNSTRTSKTLSQMDLSRNSFSLWTLDQSRRRSPNRSLDNSRGVSPPPPRMEEPQRRPIIRAYNDPRPVTYASQDVHEIVRPMTTASFPIKPALSDGPAKPVGTVVNTQLPIGGMVQRNPYPVEHLTVEGFLHSLGLDKYLISFRVEEVDMAALSQMGEHDLKEMGIPMGPRKKIVLALLARARRQAR